MKISLKKKETVTGNVSGWFESSLTIFAGKEFNDIGSTKISGAAMTELEPIPQLGGFRSKRPFYTAFYYISSLYRFIVSRVSCSNYDRLKYIYLLWGMEDPKKENTLSSYDML